MATSSCVWVLAMVVACGGSKRSPPPPVLAGSAAADTAPTPAPKGNVIKVELIAGKGVEGVIRDRATKEPLVGVTVVFKSPALQGEQVALSDETGRFALDYLPAGAYTLTAYYGEASATERFGVEDGKRSRIALDVDTSADQTQVVVVDQKPPPEYKTTIEALKHGALGQAVKLGQAEVARTPSAQLHGMLAIATYGFAVEVLGFETLMSRGGGKKTSKDFRKSLTDFSTALDKVQEHLAAAANDPKFVFELCVACMASEDGHLALVSPGALDIERDRKGKELPENDPRRQPTYRFDHGDLSWGRAMIHFQQALANVLLAYDWEWIDKVDEMDWDQAKVAKITIKLLEPARIAKARDHIVAGLAASDEARLAFVAETDDDREWVPNPKQKSYASPLAVDAKLYKTWADVVADVRLLVDGKTGISLKALWAALGAKHGAPAGFIDVGAMLSSPKEIVFELGAFDRIENEKNAGKRAAATTTLLQGILGNGHRKTMKQSKLTDRLIQLRKDVDKAGDVFEDKVKYMLWLN